MNCIANTNKELIADCAKDALELTIKMAKINSHNSNLTGIKEVINQILPVIQILGFEINVIEERNIVAFRSGNSDKKIIMLGHMDTAFEQNSQFKDIVIDKDLLRGPGVSDMKGGVALMLSFLQCLSRTGSLKDKNITLIFNSDEESGSKLSRQLIRKTATGHDLALVFEGGNRLDCETTTYLNTRQGYGTAAFKIKGKSASIAENPQDGINAVAEMSLKITELLRLTDSKLKTTVNVWGDIEVPEHKKGKTPGSANFSAEFRYSQQKELERIEKAFREIAENKTVKNSKGEFTETEYEFQLNRTAMIPCSKTLYYSKLFEDAADEINYKIVQTPRIGGSDGCITSHAGIPTIDGVGPVGGKWHTSDEFMEISSLQKRLELLIKFWNKLHSKTGDCH